MKEQDLDKKRRNSDTRPMKRAAEQYHYHSPAPQGSDQATEIHINHADHQYRITIEDQNGLVQMEEDIVTHEKE